MITYWLFLSLTIHMKKLLQAPSLSQTTIVFKSLDSKQILEQATQGTEQLSTENAAFDETVRKNIKNIVASVDKKEAQDFVEKNTNIDMQTLSEQSESDERESTEIDNEALHPEDSETETSPPSKKGLFRRMKDSVGSYVKVGAKYGTLIGAGIGAVLGVVYGGVIASGLALGGGATLGLGLALGVALLATAAGALEGLLNGALLGLLVGLIKKGVDKSEEKKK